MQLLVTPQLDSQENYWLQSLRTNLKAGEEIRGLMEKYESNRKKKDYEAVMNLITRANWEQMEVEKKMCDALKELFAEELKEADQQGAKRGRTEGIERGRTEGLKLAKSIFRLSAQGMPAEKIAETCGLSLEQVQEVLE